MSDIKTVLEIQSEIIDRLIKHIIKSNEIPNHLSSEKQEILDLQNELKEVLKAL